MAIVKTISEADDYWELWQVENFGDVLEKTEPVQEDYQDKQRTLSNAAYLAKMESEFGKGDTYHPRSLGHYND